MCQLPRKVCRNRNNRKWMVLVRPTFREKMAEDKTSHGRKIVKIIVMIIIQ